MESGPTPSQEKTRVAVASVAAALLLTGTKIIVGSMTGSLGILSEAAHSGLDLVAALVTVFAVRASARPADADHPYGHGKVENLSALFETLLLLLTCIWIIREAVERLFFHQVPVKINLWGFGVIVLSILVDFGRSRVLMAAAKKHQSQALEADALHFSTDVWSSAVVLLGLVLMFISERFRLPWLAKADAIAAVFVAFIVIWVSASLGRKTLRDLMDGVPKDLIEKARCKALAVAGVRVVSRVRIRQSGGEWFSDVVVQVDPTLSLEEAHQVTEEVERSLDDLLPRGDVVVHAEPFTQAPSIKLEGGGR